MHSNKYTVIAACDRTRVVGVDDRLPWPFNKADMNHFVATTKGHWVVMTRATYNGITHRRFPDRKVLVVHQSNWGTFHTTHANCHYLKVGPSECMSVAIDAYITKVEGTVPRSVFICGGPTLFEHYMHGQDTFPCDLIITYMNTVTVTVPKHSGSPTLHYLSPVTSKWQLTTLKPLTDVGDYVCTYVPRLPLTEFVEKPTHSDEPQNTR